MAVFPTFFDPKTTILLHFGIVQVDDRFSFDRAMDWGPTSATQILSISSQSWKTLLILESL